MRKFYKIKKYSDEQSQQDYLHKIIRKNQHMKELSDKLLAYSVRTLEERYISDSYMSVHSGLYDELSDMCGYLEEQGMSIIRMGCASLFRMRVIIKIIARKVAVLG